MSIARVMLDQSRPHLLAAKAQAIVRAELVKGCEPHIAPMPVALEPAYAPIRRPDADDEPVSATHWIAEDPPAKNDLTCNRFWHSGQLKRMPMLQLIHAIEKICAPSRRVVAGTRLAFPSWTQVHYNA